MVFRKLWNMIVFQEQKNEVLGSLKTQATLWNMVFWKLWIMIFFREQQNEVLSFSENTSNLSIPGAEQIDRALMAHSIPTDWEVRTKGQRAPTTPERTNISSRWYGRSISAEQIRSTTSRRSGSPHVAIDSVLMPRWSGSPLVFLTIDDSNGAEQPDL